LPRPPRLLPGAKTVDTQYKLTKHLKIAMLYLEDEDAVSAETFLKKAAQLITSTEDQEMQLQYKVGGQGARGPGGRG
jgi:COP9 signalosome complex subunit 4